MRFKYFGIDSYISNGNDIKVAFCACNEREK